MFKSKFNVVKIIVSFVALFVILQLGFGNDRIVIAEADVTKPELKSIEVTPREATVGETVKISVDAEDSESGIKSVYVAYQMPVTKKLKGQFLTYNSETGNFELTLNITDEIENGTWQIYRLEVEDNFGNTLDLYNQEISSLGELADLSSGNFTIFGTAGADVIQPKLNSIEVTPKEVTVGDTVKLSVDAEDEESGIKSVYVAYQMPVTKKLKGQFLTYNSETGKYELTLNITDEIENGTWQIYRLEVEDNFGNTLDLYNQEISSLGELADLSSGNFSVFGTTKADVTPPKIKSMDVSLKQATVGDTVKISIDAEDSESGIEYSYVAYQSPVTETLKHYNLTYNPNSMKYEANINITNDMEIGVWKLSKVLLRDGARNEITLYNEDLWPIFDIRTDLSEMSFIIDHKDAVRSLDIKTVIKNERWTSEVIEGDVYIGPEAVLTVNGDVTIKGDIYVLGALVSYGTLNVEGTLHATNVYYFGWPTLYNGTVHIRGGVNNIRSMSVSNRPLSDIPIEVYTDPIVAVDGVIENITGATIPVADMYVEGEKIDLRWNGTFKLDNIHVGNKEVITFTFIDVFQNFINKQFSIEHIDTITPTATASIVGGYYGKEKVVSLNMSEPGMIYYTLNGKDPSTLSAKYSKPIRINQDTILKFIAVDTYGNKSEVYTEKYRFFTVDNITDQSKMITGKVEPNSTVKISFGDKKLTVNADENGKFAAKVDSLLAGTKIQIYVIDENGIESEIIEVEVQDVTAPEAPIVDEVTDQSTTVIGNAEAGATVFVQANGNEIGRSTVGEDGSFTVEIPVQKANTELSVIVIDLAGNESEAVKLKVKDITPPSAAIVDEVTDQSTAVTGKAEVGATVIVQVNGKEIGQSTVGEDGSFTVEIPVQKANTELTVVVIDLAGYESKATKIKVKDVTPPEKPAVDDVTDQSTTITGKAEVGATVIVQANGLEIGRATVKEDGTYEVEIPVQKPYTELSVTAIDEAGNKSEMTILTVKDITPPEKPTVNPVNDLQDEVTGTAEPGTTVIIKSSDKEIGRTSVDSNGAFSVMISKQKAGSVLEITVKDKAGHVSEPAKIVVSDEKPELEKLVGKTRYTTAVEISRMGWEKSDTVFLVNGWAIADGLTATPLASAYDAPILLSRQNSIPEETMEEIKRLGAKRIVLIGGSGVISNAIQGNLINSGYEVTRIGGKTRYETSLMIAKELDKIVDVHTVYIAYGYGEPDALSIAAQAGETKQPIILTGKNYLPSETYAWLKGENIKTSYFIGGKGVISQAIMNEMNQITAQDVLGNRISGVDRQETNAKVISTFYKQSEVSTILVAHSNTDKLVDALAAGPLAAKLEVPVLLVSNKGLAQLQIETIKNLTAEKIHQVGGGVPVSTLNHIIDLVNED